MSDNYVAVGKHELGEPVGETVPCPHCGAEHAVEYGTSRRLLPDGTWSKPEPSKLLGFYRCGDSLYLASVDGSFYQKGTQP